MSKTKPIFVLNARGEKEPFSSQKAYQSAKRVGAPDDLAQDIAETIQAEAQPGMKTKEIFKRIKELLSNRLPHAAIRFSLKEGMRKLGPSGYPFENYIQAILARNNFWVEEAQTVSGRCTHHEIDFLAYAKDTSDSNKPSATEFRTLNQGTLADSELLKEKKTTVSSSSEVEKNDFPFRSQNVLYIGECKYRHRPGGRVDLPIVLAHYALFLDIKEGPLITKEIQDTSEVSRRMSRTPARWRKKMAKMEPKPILVTNTKFTSQAIEYATCVGIDLLGWKYPPGKGLEVLIDNQRLYPLTVLPSVSRDYAEALFTEKIVLVEDILKADVQKLTRKTGIPHQTLIQITEEAKLLE